MTKSDTIQMVKIKNTTVKLLILVLFASNFYFFMPVQIVNADGNTLYVDDSGGADYTSIQDAINAANESDTIYVNSGSYNENIVINIGIKLLGAGSSSVTLNGNSDHTIKVTINNVQISDLTIKNTGDSFSCIFLNSVSGCLVSNNIIKNGKPIRNRPVRKASRAVSWRIVFLVLIAGGIFGGIIGFLVCNLYRKTRIHKITKIQ